MAEEKKEPTLFEEIQELEKQLAEVETASQDIVKKQVDIFKRLVPRQIAYFKLIITELQKQIKELNEKLAK